MEAALYTIIDAWMKVGHYVDSVNMYSINVYVTLSCKLTLLHSPPREAQVLAAAGPEPAASKQTQLSTFNTDWGMFAEFVQGHSREVPADTTRMTMPMLQRAIASRCIKMLQSPANQTLRLLIRLPHKRNSNQCGPQTQTKFQQPQEPMVAVHWDAELHTSNILAFWQGGKLCLKTIQYWWVLQAIGFYGLSGNSAASQRLHLKISMAATTYQRPGRSCDSLKSTGESHELAAAETSLSLVQWLESAMILNFKTLHGVL